MKSLDFDNLQQPFAENAHETHQSSDYYTADNAECFALCVQQLRNRFIVIWPKFFQLFSTYLYQ